MNCRATFGGKECGYLLTEDAKFCPDCGNVVRTIITCHCGTVLRIGNKFCHNCGNPVQDKSDPPTGPKVCSGKLKDGTACGFNLLQGLDFCPQCGNQNSPEKDHSYPSGPSCQNLKDHPETSGMPDKFPTLFSQYAEQKWVDGKSMIKEMHLTSNKAVEQEAKSCLYDFQGVTVCEKGVSPRATVGTPLDLKIDLTATKQTDDSSAVDAVQPTNNSKVDTPSLEIVGSGKADADRSIDNTEMTNPSGDKCREQKLKSFDESGPENSEIQQETEQRKNEEKQEQKENGSRQSCEKDLNSSKAEHQKESCGSNTEKEPDGTSFSLQLPVLVSAPPPDNLEKKPESANKSYAEAAKNQKSSRYAGALGASDQKVTVVFHVIISEHFKVKPKRDGVYIRCEPHILGGFKPPNSDKHILKYIRDTEVGRLYEGKIIMTKETRDKGFMYKYIVKKPNKFEWELVQRWRPYIKNQEVVNRKFSVAENGKASLGDVHWYDGVAYPPNFKEGSVKAFVKGLIGGQTISKVVIEEALISGKIFLPSAKDVQDTVLKSSTVHYSTAEDILKNVEVIMSSLKLQMLDHKLTDSDDALAQKCIGEHLIQPLLEVLETTIQTAQRTVALGMFVLLTKLENRIFIDSKSMNLLCRAMLISPDMDQKTCPDLDDLKKQFPLKMKDKSYMVTAIKELIEKSDENYYDRSKPDWLCCVPLLHFLEGSSTPFQDLDASTSFKTVEWWGISSFTKRKERFKCNFTIAGSYSNLSDYIELWQLAFAADLLLARSLVASLEFRPLLPVLLKAPIPIKVIAATLAHHLMIESHFSAESSELLAEIFRKMNNEIIKEYKGELLDQQWEKIRCQTVIIEQLLDAFLKNRRHFKRDELFLDMTHLIFCSLDQWASLKRGVNAKNNTDVQQDWQGIMTNVIKVICQSLSSTHNLCLQKYDQSKLPHHLKMWGQLFKCTENLVHGPLKNQLEEQIAKCFESEVNKLSANDRLEVYLNQMEQVVPAFMGILNRLTFESLEEAFQQGSDHLGCENVRLISLLSALLIQKWREASQDTFTLVFEWVPMVNYLQRFNNKKSMESLETPARHIIELAMSCTKRLLNDLHNGCVEIKTMQYILDHRERFCAVMVVTGHERSHIQHILALRELELETYIHTSIQLDKLVEYCHEFLKTDDSEQVHACLEEQRDKTSKCQLCEVVTVATPDTIQNLNLYKPKSNPWKVLDKILEVLPIFHQRISCAIFRSLLSVAGEELVLSSITFWEAFQNLWSDVDQEWQTLCTEMIDGSLTLSKAEKVFKLFKIKDSYQFREMETDLRKMAEGDAADWVDKRIRQFSCFVDIKKHISAAAALMKVKEAYAIEGQFDDIKKICSLSQDASLPIRDLDESVLGLCYQLEGITVQNVRCLKDLVKDECIEFFHWLKVNMKDGLKELNVFVDLAFISAGEEPMSVHRVNYFHAAATGFAPLIFTEKVKGCHQLLNQCKLVFANVAADPNLPKKLRDSVRYINWFKDVQKTHGSVEKTSLSQVGSINARGVFRVGRGNKPETSLHQVIHLKVSEDEKGTNLVRNYSYEELLDLQSRLMLVAGQAEKGKENVDRFIMIMENLTRLGKTYVQLCSDGCVLFLDWGVEFLCDPERPVCCVSEFASEGKLKGHRTRHNQNASKPEDIEDFITGVAGFLEQCHTRWLQYLDQKRNDYQELNVYTVEQLVFLQQQLVKVGSADISKHVFPLLSLLKAECSPQDVEQAMHEAMDEVNSLEQQYLHETHLTQQQTHEVDSKDQMELFIKEVIDSGFSKKLAQKALEKVGTEDIAGGIAWCMKHEEDMDELDAELTEEEEIASVDADSGKQFVGERLKEWVTRTKTVTESAIGWLEDLDKREKGTTLKSLICSLESVWQKFLDMVSSSGTDFLSLEHLGVVLRCLATKDTRKFKRQLPPNVKPNSPNLILCPKDEVLNAVTYMYMFPQGEDALLPQPDEVLLCLENTTFEQVDIFLKRAFFGTKQKVHCLAFADSLDYDVGEKTEKKIKEYIVNAAGRNYNLVVICTSENEYRARIVAALEKFHCPSPSLSNANLVRDYLHSRFATVFSKAGVESASALDPENLCVRVVKSNRSGVGKTLYKQRLTARLKKKKKKLPREKRPLSITIPLHSSVAHMQDLAARLLKHTLEPCTILPRIVHLDISYQVLEGVDHLLYNLLILGCVTDSHGHVWLRSPMDLYLVETVPLLDQKKQQGGQVLVHQMFNVLPSLSCWSPLDSLNIGRNKNSVPGYGKHDCLFDDEEFRSDTIQRPFQYLNDLDTGRQLSQIGPQGDAAEQKDNCLAILLKYCGVTNPSWSELTHFVCFLNKQLQDFENSVFCGMAASQDLPGFSVFVLRFLVQMSRDFATRSLKMSEESLAALVIDDKCDTGIQQYELRRTWESSPHPYIFFNPDEHSMTFLGFSINPVTGDLIDEHTRQILEQGIMNKELFQALALNRVPLTENFDILPREDRLLRLYRVLGLFDEEIFDENNQIIDPDDTYELTTDNVKKILAIYMRFRCNIPVIVMGETGCGKTRLVKFLCALQTPKHKNINTMVLVKVHGGTTGEDIINKVHAAEQMAHNTAATISYRPVYTVLFFDEANTTEAIGVIKEIMCDRTLDGEQINLSENLKMVAACNPYRKHSDELIKRLENAGLGYHVDADKTVDKLGRVPMRRLVYRVQPLPQSMLPLVWDFGQLNPKVEELYIRQMVERYVRNGQLDALCKADINVLCKILMESQEFMRQLADECSFVSLRDVDRALTVTSWFLQQARDSHILFNLLDSVDTDEEAPELEDLEENSQEASEESQDSLEYEDDEEEPLEQVISDMTKALVLSLGICYRACLRSKMAYDQHIIGHFKPPFTLAGGMHQFASIIDRCQDVFLSQVHLEDNIARNQALKENVFMMVVCVELRIPLFLVGKPGSSKSLAKTIVSDAMQGHSAHSELFKTLKQAQMVSFQCSPLATADGILGTFRQCAQFQQGKNKDNFVSVVVLDEVGLAEDSPKMPLKTLHPLLEDGCQGDEVPDDSKRVAFIGISNWALDPAKMNRGILVQRDIPDEEELIETAKGICTTQDQLTVLNMKTLIPPLAKAYLKVFEEAKRKREFFGLRDFYSLVKMVYAFAAKSKRKPSKQQLIAAIRRNFGGLDTIDPVKPFKQLLYEEQRHEDDPDCTPSGLIKAALIGDDMGGESRYLLLLTENYGGLSILSENLLADHRVVPIFGSSFPKDQEYTQICRNINRIKVCMETGQTVILLNLENLYESLYDALNQYYAMLGGERYVDLGLGTHRVKCRVHRSFRLIVVAEKQVVYDKFPIPLINRLEKHFLTLNNIASQAQIAMAQRLDDWAKTFVNTGPMTRARAREKKEEVGDVFMGYHPDTCPAIVLKVWVKMQVDTTSPDLEQVLAECQRTLLWCATPDALVRSQEKQWCEVYNKEQQHEHLQQYLQQQLQRCSSQSSMLMAQVTTHSKLLTEQERQDLCQCLPVISITLLSLQAFDTEQQFCQQLRLFFSSSQNGEKLLLVQCDCGDSNQNLIKCAQYCMQDLCPADSTQHHVVFIIQLPRIAGACFTGFLGGNWHCLHIDDLRLADRPVPSITLLQSCTPAQLILASVQSAQDQLDDRDKAADLMEWEEVESTTKMEVDVDDVQVQFEASVSPTTSTAERDWDEVEVKGFDRQFVKHLFTSCIQAAVALVRDAEDGKTRATHRIAVLLCLLEDDDFFCGLHKLVGNIILEKEQFAYEADHWLSKEAARLNSVQKTGTFRRSWIRYMETKVIPVMAGAIAYLDNGDNLELLCPAREETQSLPEWTRQFWLSVLHNVCQLNYEHLRSMSRKDELEEFTVHNKGAGARPFSVRLPFSWLLWELVDSTISEAKKAAGDLLDTAGSVVEKSQLGTCLKRALASTEESLQQMFHFYISDLLYFTFPLTAPQHELLFRCVEKGLQQLRISLVQLEVGQGLVVLHMLVEQMRPRLQAILDMDGCRNKAIEAMKTGAGRSNALLLSAEDEMTEDIALLHLLVEELQPRPSQFMEEHGCNEWSSQYSSIAPVVLRILSDSDSAIQTATEKVVGEEAEEEDQNEASDMSSSPAVFPHGDRCKQELVVIRHMWTRMTVVKLFFDFVGPLRQGPQKLRKALEHVKYKLLWGLLEDDADLKKVKTLQLIDKFLKHANGFMIRGLLGRIGKCTYCEKKFESAPVELPCTHKLCNSCYRDCNSGNKARMQCPECQKPVPPEFDPATSHCQDRKAAELLGRYQRQVSGFLMAVVSQLCFAGKEPPEEAAVLNIFGYITHKSKGKTLLQTKHMTVHDDLIDPTPVLRSFLLRLLLKHSEKDVHGYLDKFLKNTQALVAQEQQLAAFTESIENPTLLEFCLLIIHCREDMYHEQDAVTGMELKDEGHFLRLANMLHNVRQVFRQPQELLTILYSLGLLRYVLDICAHVLYNKFIDNQGAPVISEEMEDLLVILQTVCTESVYDWPRKFLVKELCREYGLQAYKTLTQWAKTEHLLSWLVIEEPTKKVEEVVDRYLVCTEHYKTIRDGLAQLKLGGDPEDMTEILQSISLTEDQKEKLLLLALHREVTMSAIQHLPEEAQVQMVNNVKAFVQECDVVQDKMLGQQLCENQLGEIGSAMHVHPGQDLGVQSLVCLLTHIRLVLRPDARGCHLLNPLCALVFQSASMANAFLPTMPEDNLEEILQSIEKHVQYGEPTLWRCPNGHRYLIGDCGRPVESFKCNVCNQRIGGSAYNQPLEGNVQLDKISAERTQTGHILGSAEQRGFEAIPERELSALECTLLRFLTHAALYLAANNPAQRDPIAAMVKPKIEAENLCKFFWDHLCHDLRVLQKLLGRSADDVYLLLHHLCHFISSVNSEGHPVLLVNKQERRFWERQFASTFISPAIQDIDAVMKRGNEVIVSDKRQGDSTLMNLVYEMGEPVNIPRDQSLSDLENLAVVWRYRPRITVEHFFRHFHLHVDSKQDMKNKFLIIKLFKKEYHVIHALHYVPAILVGQRRLMMQLHRRLDRAEAVALTIEEVRTRKECAGVDALLKNFSEAWEIVKEHLITYNCMSPVEGLVSLPEEFHNASISRASPLAVLLPSTQGPGLCSYILLQFLLTHHNHFLQLYCPLIKQSYNSLPEINVHAVMPRHLVSMSPERDLLPMVLAHSNYSLMVGQAATLDYDFVAFQQQLQDTLLQCKARVQRSKLGHIPVETMVYRADITSSRYFKMLREKIVQECLSPAERRQIIEDLHDNLPEICLSIDNLSTAISFLKALGGHPEVSLHEFMSSALKMKKTIYSQKVRQMCNLTHVQSLWILLCYQRVSILVTHQKDAFDGVDKEYRDHLNENQQAELEAMCQEMTIERLELLLLQLFECIMLRLSEPRSQDDDTQPELYRLRDVLEANLDAPLYHIDPLEIRSRMLTTDDLSAFPESLQGRHATATWILCHAQLSSKRQMLF